MERIEEASHDGKRFQDDEDSTILTRDTFGLKFSTPHHLGLATTNRLPEDSFNDEETYSDIASDVSSMTGVTDMLPTRVIAKARIPRRTTSRRKPRQKFAYYRVESTNHARMPSFDETVTQSSIYNDFYDVSDM